MPTNETETSEFTLEEILCLLAGVPILGDRSFSANKRLGEYMTGIACPVDRQTPELEASADEFMAGVYYDIWLQTILTFTEEFVMRQVEEQYGCVGMLFEPINNLPDEVSDADLPDVIATFRQNVAKKGLRLTYVIHLLPLPESDRRDCRQVYDNPEYLMKCMDEMKWAPAP